MHLTPDHLRGMSYAQRVLVEGLNVEVMILRQQLATQAEPCGSDCKKSPNIRYTLAQEALELKCTLAKLEGERDEAHAVTSRVIDAMRDLVGHLRLMTFRAAAIRDEATIGEVAELFRKDLDTLTELARKCERFA